MRYKDAFFYFTLINRTGLGWIRMHICLVLKTAATACEQSRSARPRLPSHASEWPHLETGGAYSEGGSAEPDRVGQGDTVIVCFVLFCFLSQKRAAFGLIPCAKRCATASDADA